MSWVDDPSINDEVALWRRVNESMFDTDAEGCRVLQSFAFKSPNDELSMDISSETTVEKVLAAGFPTQTIVGIKAGVLRKLGYMIVRDPEPDDSAHVLVVPNPGKTKKQKHLDRQTMARNATQV